MKQQNKRTFLVLFSVVLTMLVGLGFMTYSLQPEKVLAQDIPAIAFPASGSRVSGTVSIVGTALGGTFQRYELYFKPSEASEDAYVYLLGSTEKVTADELGTWDTTDLPPGLYDLRMRVVRLDGNYAEYFTTSVRVEEQAAVPTATLTATPPTDVELSPTVTVTSTEGASVTTTVTGTEVTTNTVTATEADAEEATETVESTPTAISPVVESPTADAQIITTSSINVRAGPGTGFEIIGGLPADTSMPVTGQNAEGDWWQIEIDGGTGWVFGLLVTAENAENVPVIDVSAPASTPEPVTAIGTESEPEEGTLDEASAVEDAAVPSQIANVGPITVTLVGEDSNPELLRTFLRTMLAGITPINGSITAAIGVLPNNLPITLTIPETVTVVGGVVQAGELADSQVYLSSQSTAEELLNVIREQLINDGFDAAPQEAMTGGSGQVFLSGDPVAPPVLLCSADGKTMVNLGLITTAGEVADLMLSISPTDSFGNSCNRQEQLGRQDIFDVLPSLLPPAQTQILSSGSGSGSGSNSIYISAEAEIVGGLGAVELAAHYEAQLADAGWTQLDESQTEVLSWSAWSFTDVDENDWAVTFYVVQQGGEEDSYMATLRAESIR